MAGRLNITGRYHRLPKKMQDDYESLPQVGPIDANAPSTWWKDVESIKGSGSGSCNHYQNRHIKTISSLQPLQYQCHFFFEKAESMTSPVTFA